MRRIICIFILICILFLSGCASTEESGISDTSKSIISEDCFSEEISTTTESSTVSDMETETTEETDPVTKNETENKDVLPDETTSAEKSPIQYTNPPETTSEKVSAPEKETVKAPETSVTAVIPPEPPQLSFAEQLIENMSEEELVGQMFLARHPWTEKEAADDIKNYHLGGYILFAKDFENRNPDSVRKMLSEYQSVSDIPMLFAVDEEGGRVTRISRFPAYRSSPFSSPRNLYNEGGISGIAASENEKASLLKSLGINVNMAPVCDITTDENAFMYSRSLGQSPKITAEFVKTVLSISQKNNVGCVLKHFPGYGNNTDTHTGIAIDNRSLAELYKCDLIPFQAGINAGCGAILVSHTIIKAIDTDTPATLSKEAHKLLRNDMGFDGVIVTDDLSMQAITKVYGAEEAAVSAVLAGNDLLCCTDYAVQYNAVLKAVKSGKIPIDNVKKSVLRILKWKEELGLLK